MMTADEVSADLNRAVIISLYTWRRAATDDPVDDDERFGWWGDSYPVVADDRIGSRLWLLRRVKLTAQTQRDAEFYAREALQWLLADGHVIDLAISSEQVDINRLNLRVTLTVPGGEQLTFNPSSAWQVLYAV